MFLVQNPQLLAGYQSGKAQALHQVYLHYAPKLYSYLRKGFSFSSGNKMYRFAGLLDPVEQEALVQETFLRGFSETARKNYDGQRPFIHYLHRICRNILLQEQKKNQRYQLYESAEDIETAASLPEKPKQGQQHLLEEQELQDMLKVFLEQCGERERQVFHALYTEGDSQSEAATRLGLGRMQIRTSQQKLRKGLMQHFKETGYLSKLYAAPKPEASIGKASPLLLALWLALRDI